MTTRKLRYEITVNKGVKQGCSLSPALFNSCIDGTPQKMKTTCEFGYNCTIVNTSNMLFAEDRMIPQESEDELQKAMFKLK